jgi:hypothetical protein
MFESYEAGHLVALVLDSERENPLFRAPVRHPKQILDLGTGKGIWAMYVYARPLMLKDTYPKSVMLPICFPRVGLQCIGCKWSFGGIIHDH